MHRQEILPLTTYRWDTERTEDLFPGPRFSELCGNLCRPTGAGEMCRDGKEREGHRKAAGTAVTGAAGPA